VQGPPVTAVAGVEHQERRRSGREQEGPQHAPDADGPGEPVDEEERAEPDQQRAEGVGAERRPRPARVRRGGQRGRRLRRRLGGLAPSAPNDASPAAANAAATSYCASALSLSRWSAPAKLTA